jgi:outer membrane protein assembly factor BamB
VRQSSIILMLALLVLGLAAYHGLRRAAQPGEKWPWPKPSHDVVQWTYRVARGSPTGIALGRGDTIYFAAPDGMYALSPEGKLLWQAQLPAGSMTGAPVVAADGSIYGASVSGTVFQMDANGKLLWRSSTPIHAIPSSPVISQDGTVYAADDYADLYAFAPRLQSQATWNLETFRTGETAPEKLLGVRGGNAWERSSPSIGPDSTLILPHQRYLYDISLTGDILWFAELSAGHLTSAALGPDGTVYVGGDPPPWLIAVDREGRVKWQVPTGGMPDGSPVVDRNGNVYLCDYAGLTSVDAGGNRRWYVPGPCNSGPALAADGTLYLGMNDYLNRTKDRLAAFTLDGKVKWQIPIHGVIREAPAISSSGTIYFTSDDQATKESYVYAVRDTGAGPMNSSWPRYQHDAQNTGILAVDMQ